MGDPGLRDSAAATAAGVTVQRGLLALSIGDHMGNLISPFWYVIVAGIARVDFREFFGYGLIFAAAVVRAGRLRLHLPAVLTGLGTLS